MQLTESHTDAISVPWMSLSALLHHSHGTRDLALQEREIHLQRRLVAGMSMELPTDRAAPSGTPDRQTPPSPHCGESHQMLPALDERSWLRPRRADETQSLGTAGAQSCQAQCVCVGGGGIAEPGLGDMLKAQGWQGLIRQAWTPKRAATCPSRTGNGHPGFSRAQI